MIHSRSFICRRRYINLGNEIIVKQHTESYFKFIVILSFSTSHISYIRKTSIKYKLILAD